MNPPDLCVTELPARWRARAEEYRRYSPSAANAWEEAAIELEHGLGAEAARVLTLREAADRSGYTSDHLRRLIRHGQLPNVGRKGAPRVRLGDLPIKPRQFDERSDAGYDPVADARRVTARRAHRRGET
jgi:hypothetical protein